MIHNLFAFHGADHKVGTTMTAQSVAELISADNPDLKLLFISMHGRQGSDYMKDAPVSIDSMKFHLDNKIFSGEEFLKTCTHKGNFYMMSGITNELEQRYYHPEMARYLLEEAAPEFDLVIADTGSEIDNGLSVGALSVSESVLFLLSQQESSVRRYEKNRKLLEELGIAISVYVVSKYSEDDPFTLAYLSTRLNIDRERLRKISSAANDRLAEIEQKTLLEYKNEMYCSDITCIANSILNKSGFREIQKKRKNKWMSFI